MKQLPRILLLTGAIAIVVVALLVSGLRLFLPHLDHYRQPILQMLSSLSGSTLQADRLDARWENFGPVLEVQNLRAALPKETSLQVNRITLALDVWQSLLHARWQFRDLTFWQLHLDTPQPLFEGDSSQPARLQPNQLTDLFLRQFDHFDLRDSTFRFMTPSGQQAELSMPRLTWLNEPQRHRAEGEVSLASLTGQHGVVQLRLDLRDQQGLLDSGRIWLQADDIDVKPWLGQWMRDNTSLTSARFSLSAWVSLEQGTVAAGDLLLHHGGARWQGDGQRHSLAVNNLTAHLSRAGRGWALNIPNTHMQTDGQAWPDGHVGLLWLPAKSPGGGEMRLRATRLDLARVDPLLPLLSGLSPALLDTWRAMQPRGQLDALALDIPLAEPESTRFQARWRNLSWQPWKLVPGMQHVAGSLSGSVNDGRVVLDVQQATVPYDAMFHAPLAIQRASGSLSWQYNADGVALQGRDLDVRATSLWATGDFRWSQPKSGAPRLDILAGINLSDAAEAWRYFPEPLMGQDLVDYLSGALKGGHVNNATLLFAGDPSRFPFRHHDGQFQVSVPLRDASFAFQPGWPALSPLDADLDFRNDGLWIRAPSVALGKVDGNAISAVIPDYLKETLIIDGEVRGTGQAVGDYFQQTPLRDSLGAALEALQIGGSVGGHLHLTIPLNGEEVEARGNVDLRDNSLLIKPLETTLTDLSGQFRYRNGDLESDTLSARWFGQPTRIRFTTNEQPEAFHVGVTLQGDWALNRLVGIPHAVAQRLQGSVPWQGDVALTLPPRGGARYDVQVNGNLQGVASTLPAPLAKARGESLPVKLVAQGDLKHFTLSGNIGPQQRFNSRWLLGETLRLDRGVLVNDARRTPPLPATPGMTLNLPPLDGEAWATLLAAGESGNRAASAALPGNIMLLTPRVALGGQDWHDVSTTLSPLAGGGTQLAVRSRELNGGLTMPAAGRWQANIRYLYYNPGRFPGAEGGASASPAPRVDFSDWPALNLHCEDCWVRGQKLGRVSADLTPRRDVLTLSNGLIDTGTARLTASGEWVNRPGAARTSLKGTLSGKKINAAINWFGLNSPLQDAPFKLDYDLHWRAAPWQPSPETLSGVLKSSLGAGHIADVNTGRAGQLLRLFSFDALLRKLRLDFSDTFSQGFYFDSITGTAWIKDGVMRTENLLIDGLEADIAMQGDIDLVRRRINMEAVVAPEISASVGVAAAFAVNPIVGAAVFAASKVLAPLWNKISLLRYHISGPIDKPEINEVLRKPRNDRSR
ncbi:AsmA2 domain-containing protein YhdP [Pantoea sp. 1.19]|uniref:AsmA2 domain-containing protein YhdP n=1 Tax=Pantoea sp. 1.19 TaxID=1925589 RepID=UPI000948BC76|nr:AsmA2 domain-containing protein YhdP [Pantoea sp. 1.19]